MFNYLYKLLISILRSVYYLIFPKSKSNDNSNSEYQTIIVDYNTTFKNPTNEQLNKLDGIVRIILNRPNKKNAFNELMYYELMDILNKLSTNQQCKMCIITGNGDFYCSGNDLANFIQLMHPLSMAKKARYICENVIKAFINFKKPLICIVNGPAIGIAVTTLGLCDRVYAIENAYFKTPFALLGQSPEGCSTYTFPKIMGTKIANDVLYDNRVLTATEALECNLVHDISSSLIELDYKVYQYCNEALTQNNPLLLQRCLIRDNLVNTLLDVNKNELDILEKKFISKECFNNISKFLDTRKMFMASFLLKILNFLGPLWGQPQ